MSDDTLLPELARSLRSLGTAREPCSREAHDVVFSVLLDARARAGHESKAKALAALEGSILMPRISAAALATASRGVQSSPRARALAAQARELTMPLNAAFTRLDAASALAPTSDAGWELWVDALRAVYTTADSLCEALAQLFAERDAATPVARWFGGKRSG